MRDKLPDFMIPSAFVFLSSIPLTPNGKIDKKALPSPERGRKDTSRAYVPPNSDLERSIALIWKELLGLDEIGTGDNFFDLGANSLLMMRANAKIRAAVGKSVALVDMFRFPTVAALSSHLSEKAAAPEVCARAEGQDRAQARLSAAARRRGVTENVRTPLKR